MHAAAGQQRSPASHALQRAPLRTRAHAAPRSTCARAMASSATAPAMHRVGATYRVRGLALTEHYFNVRA
jgi:hypothetical protein